MTKAIWKGVVIAESDKCIEVESNQYFPQDSINKKYFKKNTTEKYTCPWKGETQYWDVVVDGETNSAAAWSYPDPKPAAKNITGYFAFWRGVEVKE